MSEITKNEFLREYSAALLEDRAAAFVGAGLSVGAGFVDWKELLRDVASDLGLDIDEEHDLIAIAQYEVNRKGGRDSLDRRIVQKFNQEGQLHESHRLLARLPLDTIWTTNYDCLLEKAFSGANKRYDTKFEVEHLKTRHPYTDVSIFKMHGDVSRPSSAVLTKDDYERFEVIRGGFTDQLKVDLLTRQFLFLGFSFSDPNIEYTFNRLRRIIDPSNVSPREHYCILRRPQESDSDGAPERFSRLQKKFEYRVNDLSRFGVQVVPIDAYSEIPELLQALNRRVNTQNVLISGAAHDFSPFGRERTEAFCKQLGAELVRNGFNIVSGFGLGISGAVIIGAHEEVARSKVSRLGQRLRLYPFPYNMEEGEAKKRYYDDNRTEMASQAGASIYIAGNRFNGEAGCIEESPGVREEFRKANEAGHICIPVKVTGHAAAAIWNEMEPDLETWFPGLDVPQEFESLAKEGATDKELINAIITILNAAKEQDVT